MGFSYMDHYLPTNGTEANGVNAQKLHLTVSGLRLRADAQNTSEQPCVPTNVEASSGVFAKSRDSSPAVSFPVPTVSIAALTQFTYYAKLVYDANGGQNPPAPETMSVTTTESSAAVSFDQGAPNPTRTGYTFKGWSTESGDNNAVNVSFPYTITTNKTTESTAETKTVYAVWETNKYTVTWKNEDGTVLETDTDVSYGTMPEYIGAMPIKASDGANDYAFCGWTPIVVPVSGNASFTATYTKTAYGTKTVVVDFSMKYLLAENVSEKPADPANGKLVLDTDGKLYFTPTADDYTAMSKRSVVLVTHKDGTHTNVTIIPADNIYYDDDLKNKTANQDKVQGYDASVPQTSTTILKNESGTLTFRFTGTRCDVYCTTDANTGWVMMKYYAVDKNGTREKRF